MEIEDNRSQQSAVCGYELDHGDVFSYVEDLTRVYLCCSRLFGSDGRQALDLKACTYHPVDLSKVVRKYVARLVVSDA